LRCLRHSGAENIPDVPSSPSTMRRTCRTQRSRRRVDIAAAAICNWQRTADSLIRQLTCRCQPRFCAGLILFARSKHLLLRKSKRFSPELRRQRGPSLMRLRKDTVRLPSLGSGRAPQRHNSCAGFRRLR